MPHLTLLSPLSVELSFAISILSRTAGGRMCTQIMEATINEVFYADQQTRVELGTTRPEAVTLDWQRFPRFPCMSAEVTESKDPSDGGTWQLRIETLIDGVVMKGATNWIPNDDDNRTRVFTHEIDKHPVKLMQRGKTHSVQFRLSRRRMVWGVPVPLVSKWEEIAESEVYYYKIGTNPNME